MFFDAILVKNSELKRVWRAGFGRMDEHSEGNTSLPDICRKVDQCVGSEDPDPRRRVSLRTSAVLVDGAARVYRQELGKLIEEIYEVDNAIVKRNKRKTTDSEENSLTDSSNTSEPYDSPENMMRQVQRHSDISIQKPTNKSNTSLKAANVSHSLSSISNSTDNQEKTKTSSENEAQNGQSEKRRKINSDETDMSSDYPSSLELSVDRNSESPYSDEAADLTDNNQNIPNISDNPTQDQNAIIQADDQTRGQENDDQVTVKSSEVNSDKRSDSPTFTEIFDYVAALPNYDPEMVIDYEDANQTADQNSDNITREVVTQNSDDINITVRNKDNRRVAINSDDIRNSDGDSDIEVDNTSDNRVRDDISTRSIILSTSVRKLPRRSHRVKKITKRSIVKKDQASQTEDIPFHPNERERDLPFGYLLIHDSYDCRYPSKIVVSSLNANVRNLIPGRF